MIKFLKKYYFIIVPLFATVYMLLQGVPLNIIDDHFMLEIAKSFQTNAHSEQLVFINVTHGYILKFLYNLIPSVNWFAVLYLSVVNIAFVPIYRITQNYNNKLIFVGITFLMQIAVFSHITFTIMSFVCATSAILWALEYVKSINKHTIKHIILIFFMYLLGFSMRSGGPFICVFLISLPIYFLAVIKRKNSIYAVAILLALCVVANYTNINVQKSYKNALPDELYYKQFQEYRSKVSDTAMIDYEKNKSELESIGITKNDLKLYKTWKYADKNVFSAENLQKISSLQTFSNKYLLDISSFSIDKLAALVVFSLFAVTMFCFILLKDRRKEILLLSIFIFGAIFYLFFRKKAPFRVVFSINILGVMNFMYIAMQELRDKISLTCTLKRLAYVMLVLIFLGLNVSNIVKIYELKATESDTKKVVEYINSNSDKKYLTDERGRWLFSPSILSLQTNETDVPPPNIFGDWYIYSYYWYDQLDRLGLSEYKDCTFKAVLEEDVRVICTDEKHMTDLIATFLYEHYDIPVEYNLEDIVPGTDYAVYKFSISD